MLRIEDVAQRLGVSARTASRWRQMGCFPPAAKEGKPLLFAEADVEKWLAEVDPDSGLTWREFIRLDEREAAEIEAEARAEVADGWGPLPPGVPANAWQIDQALGKLREARERLDALEAILRRLAAPAPPAKPAERHFVGLPPLPEPEQEPE